MRVRAQTMPQLSNMAGAKSPRTPTLPHDLIDFLGPREHSGSSSLATSLAHRSTASFGLHEVTAPDPHDQFRAHPRALLRGLSRVPGR